MNPDFNPDSSAILYLDINSCFATIEQQTNIHLRHKPIAVAAYDTPSGCIVAPSVEAKKLGIKVGMRVRDAKEIYPQIIVLTPNPDKYRQYHLLFKQLLSQYTPDFSPRSIDEFVLDFSKHYQLPNLWEVAREIKQRIKMEIGDYLTVSIGLGPNRFLAKTASNLHKPDGLDEINYRNYLSIYQNLELTDLSGINTQNALRLNLVGIYTVSQFLSADIGTLNRAFKSVLSRDWYLRLRGWEVDERDWGIKSFGHSYSLPKPFSSLTDLGPVLAKLIEKMSLRLREAGYQARGVSLAITYKDRSFWHQSQTLDHHLCDTSSLYKAAHKLLSLSPGLPVHNLSVSCFQLAKRTHLQLDLFGQEDRMSKLNPAIDKIKAKYGQFSLTQGNLLGTKDLVPDRISFNKAP